MFLVEILLPITILILLLLLPAAEAQGADFIYNGFRDADLVLGDIATLTQNGLLRLTNNIPTQKGRAFYRAPLHFKNSSGSTNATRSFSTTFVSAIVPQDPNFNGHGLAFVISPSVELPGGVPAQFLGIFNPNNNGNSSNHIFAIEHDTVLSPELNDIADNHVGIDINGLVSNKSAPAAYFYGGRWNNFSLSSGSPIQTWIEYDGTFKQLTVTVAPINLPRPPRPLLSAIIDLAPVFVDPMYVGFSSSTGQLRASHYILGWSYNANGGQARALNLSSLPTLPRFTPKPKPKILTIGLPIIAGFLSLAAVSISIITIRKKIKYSERFQIVKGVAAGLLYLHEEWEQLVLHRDVKASNVLLDGDLNGKLGDFGLARLYDHGAAPKTTHVVGTIGYLAPELTRTSKATTSTDVFALGVFMLEVATGRRPVQYPEGTSNSGEEVVLRQWVYNCWKRGSILEVSDPKLRGEYIVDEIELVLKLGLVCSNPAAVSRPGMRQVIQILEGRAALTELVISSRAEGSPGGHGYSTVYYNSSTDNVSVETESAVESLLSGGR
ncbi:hypothetical protein H6P81_007504 [Aristolochia fimbriata]|uniref:non-specific serine/threonine protein kinase n=1 Tax=Aristolochia fimbriata TaxID=158543 RepID=A0AAV7F2Q0_ARIFI|nr:hypothetical protein H6P81_007504 [Aristolochia fimbriata]